MKNRIICSGCCLIIAMVGICIHELTPIILGAFAGAFGYMIGRELDSHY